MTHFLLYTTRVVCNLASRVVVYAVCTSLLAAACTLLHAVESLPDIQCEGWGSEETSTVPESSGNAANGYVAPCENRMSKSNNDIFYSLCVNDHPEGFQIAYHVLNRQQKEAIFNFSLGCKFDMIVTTADHDTLYRYLDNIPCSLLPSSIELQPDECVTKTFPLLSVSTPHGPLTVTASLNGYRSSAVSYRLNARGNEQQRTSRAGTRLQTGQEILRYSPHARSLAIAIPSPQKVTISVYIINGQKVKQLSVEKHFSTGVHNYSLAEMRQFNSGLLVIEVQGETFSERKVINIME